MKIGFAVCFALMVGSVRAMPPKEGVVIPQDLLARMAELPVDIARQPVRDPGKAGQFNTMLSVQTLVSGTKKFPVVLVKYTDVTQQYTVSNFQTMLFDSAAGWPSGSARNWYTEVSYGQLSLTGTVYGWLTSDSSRAYYGGNFYGLGTWPRCAGKLVLETAQKSDPSVNFADYDNDQDGYVDCFTVVHCGYGAEETGNRADIWSHMAYLTDWTGSYYVTNDPDPNHPGQNIKIDLYTIDPERSAVTNNGTMVCIGVFVHEWGHAFGLPDLYDTDGGGQGLGNWCCIAAGSWGGNGRSPWYPSHFCAWAKIDLGWIAPVVVAPNNYYSIVQVETNPQAYQLWTWGEPNKEYFLIENRQKTRYDTLLYNSGLLIYHIDQTVIDARRPQNLVNAGGSYPYGVALEQADGQNHLWLGRNRGDTNDIYPGGLNKTAFDSSGTNPDSRSNAGVNSRCGVNQIPLSEPSMNCWLYVGPTPAAPSDLIATVLSDHQIQLTWKDNAVNENNFSLERKPWEWGAYQEIFTPPANDSSYLDQESVYPKTTYWYRLRAWNKAGYSPYSNEDSATTYGPPDPPSLLKATVVSSNEILISWLDNSEDEDNFSLERKTEPGAWSVISQPLQNFTTFSDRQVSPGKKYFYRCRASNQWGFSEYSNVDSALIPVGVVETKPTLPTSFGFVVPIASAKEIRYDVPKDCRTLITIFDLSGTVVKTLVNEKKAAGSYRLAWDGRDNRSRFVPAGLYFYRMRAGNFVAVRKVIKL